MNILAELCRRLETVLRPLIVDGSDPAEKLASMVRPAQQEKFGDFQANCAMSLAKARGENPREVAQRIVDALNVDDLCLPPEVAGPGFINFTLRDDWLAGAATALGTDERLGVERPAVPRRYIVDYSAPNIAKPMHVGHLRSTVIGAALCRVLRFLGHEALGDNHIGDWGTQFGMIIYGYKHFLDAAAYQADPVGELARLYRFVNQLCDHVERRESLPQKRAELAARAEELDRARAAAPPNDKNAAKALRKLEGTLAEMKSALAGMEQLVRETEADPEMAKLLAEHPQILVDTRRETARLHAGDPENKALWDQFLPACLGALNRIYDRLGVRFDLVLGESFYQPLLGDVVDSLVKAGIARESEGAICVFPEGHEAPFIIRKSDGAFTYATTDLATIRYRVENHHADAMLYVVDARQSEHFRALFDTARRWGYGSTGFHHVSFGTILGDDKRPFKTRSGDTVGLESLIDEAVARARQIVDENDDAREIPELDEPARAAVAEIVGIGGIKYADLRHNRESDYVFSWEKMLAKTGDTATYIQYSFARICGIFRKGGIDRDALRRAGHRVVFTHPSERRLALHLNRFGECLEAVASDFRPNLLTQHLFETADRFTTFYENCPVLKEEDDAVRNSRLLLCDLTARTLKQGLELLGIGTSEQM